MLLEVISWTRQVLYCIAGEIWASHKIAANMNKVSETGTKLEKHWLEDTCS